MENQNFNAVSTKYLKIARMIGIIAIIVSCSVILGWVFNLGFLKSISSNWVSMKGNSAFCFILISISLILTANMRLKNNKNFSAGFFVLVVFFVAVLTLLQDITNTNFYIDQWLFQEITIYPLYYPGRMAPITSISFILLCIALFLSSRQIKNYQIANLSILAILFLSLLEIVGYIFGVGNFSHLFIKGHEFAHMAFHTAILFFLLGVSIAFLNPTQGTMSVLLSRYSGGTIARKLLPFVFIIPVTIGYLRMVGQWADLYSSEFGIVLSVSSTIVLLMMLILYQTKILNHLDYKRLGDEQILRSILENTNNVINIKDLRGDYLLINKAFENKFNRNKETIIGKNVFEILSVNEAKNISANDEIVMQSKKTHFFEESFCQNNQAYIFLANKFPLFDDEGKIYGVGEISVDITERRRIENELHRLAAIIACSKDAIISATVDGIITSWNPAAEKLYGYTANETINRSFTFLIPEDKHDEIINIIQKLKHGEQITHFETIRKHKNGQNIPVSNSVFSIKDASNNIIGIASITRDLREQKLADERFKNILEATPDATIIVSTDGKIIFANAQTEKIFGYTKDELIDKPIEILIPEPYPQRHQQHKYQYFNNLYPTPIGSNMELFGQHKNLSKFPIEISLSPLDMQGEKTVLASIRDITERKRLESLQREANKKLEENLIQLNQHNQQLSLLKELSAVLQACFNMEEAYDLIGRFTPGLLPETSGILFLLHSSHNYFEAPVTWENPILNEKIIKLDDCWALRRGNLHKVENPKSDLICLHSKKLLDKIPPYLCIPLLAQGDIIGLLYIEWCNFTGKNPDIVAKFNNQQILAITLSEQIALAISNIQLRESLRNQSFIDTLTGLYNRRYLEETLERELYRSKRNATSISVLMLDVDHFKEFNDNFGHDAGDKVLRRLSLTFKENIRKGDIASRYGGEEFILVLIDAGVETAKQRAEIIREEANRLQLQHDANQLGLISVSIGIAIYPIHGTSVQELITAADKALYKAKHAGRNNTMISEKISHK